MSSVPPITEVVDALIRVVVPAFGVSALAGYVMPRIFGRKSGYIAAALAILLGMFAANIFRGIFVFRFDSETPLSAYDFARGFWEAVRIPNRSLETAPAELFSSPRAGRYWIPTAIALSVFVDLISDFKKVPSTFRLIVRFCVTLVAVRLIVPVSLFEESPWVPGLVVLGVFAQWAIAEQLCLRAPAGLSIVIFGFAALGASVVLIHAHSARLTDAATVIVAVSFGIAVAARWGQADAAGAIPAVAVFLPAVLLSGYHETFSAIPTVAFALPALAPLAAGFLLLIPEPRLRGWRAWVLAALVVGTPLAVAIVLVVRSESLSF